MVCFVSFLCCLFSCLVGLGFWDRVSLDRLGWRQASGDVPISVTHLVGLHVNHYSLPFSKNGFSFFFDNSTDWTLGLVYMRQSFTLALIPNLSDWWFFYKEMFFEDGGRDGALLGWHKEHPQEEAAIARPCSRTARTEHQNCHPWYLKIPDCSPW